MVTSGEADSGKRGGFAAKIREDLAKSGVPDKCACAGDAVPAEHSQVRSTSEFVPKPTIHR